MPSFRPTPFTSTTTLRAVSTAATGGNSTSALGLFPRPVVVASPAQRQQRHNFFLPALQQRFGSSSGGFTSPSTPGGHAGKPRSGSSSSSASKAMDEMMDADIDISDPPEAVGASNAATARAAREERMGGRGRNLEGDDMGMGGNKMLYASAGALGLLGLYSVFKENPEISGSSSSKDYNPEMDPGVDARGRTTPISSIKPSRQHHELPAHAPGGETVEFKLGRG